jgi:hypothetical protein
MAVEPNKIEVDKCYATNAGQVRRVLEILGDDVKYVARGQKSKPEWWKEGSWITVNRQKFAEDVEKEVRCDYDPNFASGASA